MNELLADIERIDDAEEDVLIHFQTCAWTGTSLTLCLEVTVSGSEPKNWKVSCGRVLAHNLCYGTALFLTVTDNHPLLWQFQEESASAYFSGVPSHVQAAVGALYEAHVNAVGLWIPFSSHLNALPLSKLLATGNGLLARGPVGLLQLYRDTLEPFGTRINICSPYQPQIREGDHWLTLDPHGVKVLLIGSSYVIGSEWTAYKVLA